MYILEYICVYMCVFVNVPEPLFLTSSSSPAHTFTPIYTCTYIYLLTSVCSHVYVYLQGSVLPAALAGVARGAAPGLLSVYATGRQGERRIRTAYRY